MKRFLIGRSPFTTLAGFILAVLLSIHQVATTGAHKWQDFILPAAIAVFGRIAGDDNKRPPLPPLPIPAPGTPDIPPALATNFLRRGRQHSQTRHRDGRFARSSI